ncbi:hypothetical protein ACIQPR_00105 [Streptomyces sp. NPDC091280]|uniref:hypothetical protein n=1 Tax=Streptomyces sp. NPDC091280 TaxID=3365984 RepID=UPI0038261CFA
MTETSGLESTRNTSSRIRPFCGVVEKWLASAHPSPRTALEEWDGNAQLALIPLGRGFEAVRIPEDIVHAFVGSDSPATVNARLAEGLNGGPVIRDPGFRRYYALVPPGTAAVWRAPVAECIAAGTYLGVPRTDRVESNGGTSTSYWSVPMSRPNGLRTAAEVLALVRVGHSLVSEDEP